MSDYFLTSDAEEDLVKIRDYTVNNWGIEQSRKYLTELRDIFRLIAETPRIGTQRSGVGENVFSFPYASHMLYYAIHDELVVFFGVLHRSMVPENHLPDRER